MIKNLFLFITNKKYIIFIILYVKKIVETYFKQKMLQNYKKVEYTILRIYYIKFLTLFYKTNKKWLKWNYYMSQSPLQ